MNKLTIRECELWIKYLTKHSKTISKIIMKEESWWLIPQVKVIPRYENLKDAALNEAKQFFKSYRIEVL